MDLALELSTTQRLTNQSDVVYTADTAKGPLALTITAIISLCSVLAVIISIIVTGCRTRHEFLRSSVGPFFVSLLLSDLLQAIGSFMNLRWMIIQRVHEGAYCTAQAGLKQTGNVGTALWSMIIAMHTFTLLFLRRPLPRKVGFSILAVVWLFQGFIVMLGPVIVQKFKQKQKGPFWGISGYWCWISNAYHVEQLTNEYLYMFLTVLVSFILYSLIFLRLRGNLRGYRWSLRFGKAERPWEVEVVESDNDKNQEVSEVGKQMLWYPIAYTVIILPIAICRWSIIFGHKVPYWAIMLADSIFMLSGLVNAILYATTTRKIISLPRRFALSRLLVSRQDDPNNEILHSKTSLPHMDFVSPLSNGGWEDFQQRRSLFYNLSSTQPAQPQPRQSNHLSEPRKASEFPEEMRSQVLKPKVMQRHDLESTMVWPSQPPMSSSVYNQAHHHQRLFQDLEFHSEPQTHRSSVIHPFANPHAYVSPRRSPILPTLPLSPSYSPARPAFKSGSPATPALTPPAPSRLPNAASISTSPRLSPLGSDSDSSFANFSSHVPSSPSQVARHKRLSTLGFPLGLERRASPSPSAQEQSHLSASPGSYSNAEGEFSSWSSASELESMRFAAPSPEQLRKLRNSAGGALELIGGYDSTPFPPNQTTAHF